MNKTPPAKRLRTKPAETRREELMDAAQALFLDQGFDATSVDEIVKGAGVAKGTYYTYFKTKDEVLSALRERFIGSFQECLEAALDQRPADDWAGRLDAWIDAAVNAYLDQLALHDLVFHQFRPSTDRLHQANPVTTHLGALIEAGAQAGAWAAGRPPRLAAAMVFSALHGAVDDSARPQPGQVNRKDLIRAVQTFCRMGLQTTAR